MDTATFQAIELICDRLSDRNAVLFLGAGINYGIQNADGLKFPLGDDLAKMIGSGVLGIPDTELSLQEVAEIARHKLGSIEFNNYLRSILNSFPCSASHISLLNLPWDCVFTTNYDTLLEKAHAVSQTKYHRNIQPIFSNATQLASLAEDVLPSYKLHGCVDYSNTEEGRLIITQTDYRFYETNRRKLFLRLERDLQSRCMVFIGYSLKDPNFLASLSDACEALDVQSLPRSFAIRKDFTETEADYWLDRFNIQLINSTGTDFISALESTWSAQQRLVFTPQQRLERQMRHVDDSTSLPLWGDAFHQLKLGQITGKANPTRFFQGGEPRWPDIRDKIAPRRLAYWSVMEAIFPEISDPTLPPSVSLITGSAGTGKTTLIKTICFDLLNEYDPDLPVLLHIAGVPLNASDLLPLSSKSQPKRIVCVFASAAADHEIINEFHLECSRLKLPVTILLEERKNQWVSSRSQRTRKISLAEFELGELHDSEIEDILDALCKHDGCLGGLANEPRANQTAHFQKLAKKDLLVALRELTSGTSFDEIVKDEFNKIPTAEGRQAYLYAAAFGQIDLPLRYETLQHLLQINFSEFTSSVFNPTEGILLTSEIMGNSRHNFGFRVRVRHPIIASIIFAEGAPDDEAKFEVINQVLARLDPGYGEDRRVLQAVVRRKELVNTFADPELRRALFARLAQILPDEPYILQHRSILERDLGNGQAAIRYARQSLKREGGNLAFKNTLGFALEFASRTASGAVRDGLCREAKSLFEEGISRNKRDPYGYLGIASLMKQRIVEEFDVTRATLLKAELLAFLEEAFEATEESSQVATQLASIKSSLGDHGNAIAAIKKGLSLNPTDTRLRAIWIDIEMENRRYDKARTIALEGLHSDATSWRLHRYLARINRRRDEPVNSVTPSYDAAIRHHKGDCALLVEYGSYLFMSDLFSRASTVFQEAYRAAVNSYEAKQIREEWKDAGGARRFEGKVISTSGASGTVLAIPENFEAFFWRTRNDIALLQYGDTVQFTIGFNTYGAVAHVLRRK